jgi:hypothetical protein
MWYVCILTHDLKTKIRHSARKELSKSSEVQISIKVQLANRVSTPQADFFIGYHVGAITLPEKFMGASSCFADFNTYEQARRAMEAMDGMPLLGREVEIEFAKVPKSGYK